MSKASADASMDFLLGGGKNPKSQSDPSEEENDEARQKGAEGPARSEGPIVRDESKSAETASPVDKTFPKRRLQAETDEAEEPESEIPGKKIKQPPPPSGTYLGNGLYQRADGPRKKVEIYIDPALDKRLRIEAAERDTSKAEVIAELIERYYDRR